jgi:TonB-linked SusC/RagA family outer membrane protein
MKNCCDLPCFARRRWEKITRVMKLTMTLFLFAVLAATAGTTYSQTARINLKMKDATLVDVFREIERTSEFGFFFKSEEMDLNKHVSIDLRNATIEEVLKKILIDNYDYRILDKNIIVTRGNFDTTEQQQQKSVSGKVTDSSGAPIPGVSVVLKGTTNGTITDTNGNYSLSNIPGNATLQFSFVGMKMQELVVEGKTIINVSLAEETIGIEEVVAIGYGVQKKSDLTGAISSISSVDIEKQASNNITQILRGGIAGIDASLSNSAKGTGDLLIRGRNSLKANNSPLIVVDGMIYDGDIADINTSDVESIDILKDASSAAVFGARAASGVIMITTKKGEKGKPKINFNNSVGFSSLQNIQKVFDTEGYLNMRMDYWETNRTEMPVGYYRNPTNLPSDISLQQWRNFDGNSPLSDTELWFSRNKLNGGELKNYLKGSSVDWYDQVFRTGLRQDYNVSISGASDNVSYYYSLGYVNNEGFRVDEKYENFRSRFNLESNVTDFLKVGINGQYSRRNESSQYPDIPVSNSPIGNIYNEDGTYKLYDHSDGFDTNPFYYRYSDKFNISNDLLANIYSEIKLPWGFAYRCNWINRIQWSSDYSFQYTTNERTGSGGSRTEYNYNKWYVDNILTWNKTFSAIHKFDFTFLYNVEKASSWKSIGSNSTFMPSETLGYHQLSFGANPVVSDNDETLTADALMARLNYSLLQKYLFTVAIRRDGYSVFGAKNPWANFPSAAFAWRISEEDFFKVKSIDYLKLRISYGINGNRDIATYQSLAYLNPYKYIYQTENGKQTFSGYYSSRMANAGLRWEQTSAWNAGIDFSILGEKLSGTIEGYRMSTNDLILDRSLPYMTGYGAITTNLGEVQNKGIEITLNSRNIQKQNFEWASQLIFSLNRNEIKHLYGNMEDVLDKSGNVIGQKESNDYTNNWFIGEDIDRIYDYELNGIWQEREKAEAAKFGLQPGDFRVVDQNGDGKISSREDKIFLGYYTPQYKVSLLNNFTLFKNFDVSFLLNAQLGFYGSNNEHFHTGFEYGRLNRYEYPYWTKNSPLNEFASLDSSNPYNASYYVNRSFVKLQNLSIGYRVPSRYIQAYKIQNMRLSFNLQNAISMTAWDFWDPETKTATPMLGTFTVNITL